MKYSFIDVYLMRILASALIAHMAGGCALDTDMSDNIDEEEGQLNKPPLPNRCAGRTSPFFGVDTNQVSGNAFAAAAAGQLSDGLNFDIPSAIRQDTCWVGRYIVSDECHSGEHCDTTPPVHVPVTRDEVDLWHEGMISVAFLWESGNHHRACSAKNKHQEYEWGQRDALHAKHYMNHVLRARALTVIYFAVDFAVTSNDWNSGHAKECNQHVATGEMIASYFSGIASRLRAERVGVYGSYTTVHALLGDAMAPRSGGKPDHRQAILTHAWQQTFHSDEPIDGRAELRQYDIYPLHPETWEVMPGPEGLISTNPYSDSRLCGNLSTLLLV